VCVCSLERGFSGLKRVASKATNISNPKVSAQAFIQANHWIFDRFHALDPEKQRQEFAQAKSRKRKRVNGLPDELLVFQREKGQKLLEAADKNKTVVAKRKVKQDELDATVGITSEEDLDAVLANCDDAKARMFLLKAQLKFHKSRSEVWCIVCVCVCVC
jgi:hypothetical protein